MINIPIFNIPFKAFKNFELLELLFFSIGGEGGGGGVFGRLKIERLLGYLLNGRTHTHTRGEGIPFEEPRMTFFTFCTILMQRWYLVL